MLALAAIGCGEGHGLERGQHVLRRRKPRGGVFLEDAVHDFDEGVWHVVACRANIRRSREEVVLHHAGDGIGGERKRAGERLEGDNAERVLIALGSGASAGALLRTHERRCADHRAVDGQVHVRGAQRDSVVGHQDASVAVHENVGALDVTVHDMAVVSVGERTGGAAQDVQRDRYGERALRVEDQAERTTLDELHGDDELLLRGELRDGRPDLGSFNRGVEHAIGV